jgi:hypothetical protein
MSKECQKSKKILEIERKYQEVIQQSLKEMHEGVDNYDMELRKDIVKYLLGEED